jgi:hypothetical protein
MSSFSLLSGIGKGGKTTLLAHLAASVVSGRPFLARETRAGPVLWVDLEQHVGLTADKLTQVGAVDQPHRVHVANELEVRLDQVEEAAERCGAVLIVIDSLSRLLRFRDENDASEVTRKLGDLLTIPRRTGAALVAIHHDRKREGSNGRSVRGSSAILAACDVSISLKLPAGASDTRRTLDIVSRYEAARGSLTVSLGAGGYSVDPEQAVVRAVQVLEAIASDNLSADELGERLQVSRVAAAQKLRELHEQGRLIRSGSGKKGSPFRFGAAPKAESAAAS